MQENFWPFLLSPDMIFSERIGTLILATYIGYTKGHVQIFSREAPGLTPLVLPQISPAIQQLAYMGQTPNY